MNPLPHTRINLTADKLSGLTASGQPFNLQANYKPHYVLSVLFPHHINSAIWSDRLRTDVEWHRRTEMSPVYVHDLYFNKPTLFFQSLFLYGLISG